MGAALVGAARILLEHPPEMLLVEPVNELFPEFTISIAEQVSRGCIPRKSLHDLPSCPSSSR